ncbi:MAG: histidine kinase N-terminal 7TM domain-containing protein [Candidatus Promineifilaceae bacterium]|nr:histidine kinase N-terminal 7TM domain-containing protein [Candidatus Promineifilaceae bacterium]
MFEELPDFLSLVNDVIQAAIVVFGGSVALYNVPHSFRDRVTRAFNSLIFFVIIVFFAELAVTRTTTAVATEVWIRLQWIGIAMVPAAQFHLADALLVTTGDISRRRRLSVRVWYLTGVTFFLLALFSDLLVNELHVITHAAHLGPGPLFPLFAVYYWLLSAASVNMVWRARRRCLTHTTRRRMTMILIAILAAPLAVFPYLLLSQDQGRDISSLFWLLLIAGNLTVGIMFSLLTYYIAYFGAISPDRVVRVRLFKFMARVPLAATIVLLVYVGFSQAGSVLGLRPATALAVFLVLAIVFSEWAIHAFKRPLERVFQLTDEPEVRRIQELSERVLTTRDLHQFLESVLAATCEVLRSPTAFVAAFTADGPQLEAVIGPLEATPEALPDDKWQQLARPAGNSGGQPALTSSNGFFLWRDYWIRPLLDRSGDLRLGILGVRARSPEPDLSEIESATFERLARLAADALEDRILQQEVFAAVEGLLPQVTELQQRRSAATFGGTNYLIAPTDAEAGAGLTSDPEFNSMVWDALSHYWGGPKLTDSPLMRLRIVQRALMEEGGNPTNALREILARAVEQQRPDGERSMTTAEWLLYNILELKFIQGQKVRDVARRLAMSESDLYRKQRVAIENVARTISSMEEAALEDVDRTLANQEHETESAGD